MESSYGRNRTITRGILIWRPSLLILFFFHHSKYTLCDSPFRVISVYIFFSLFFYYCFYILFLVEEAHRGHERGVDGERFLGLMKSNTIGQA